jgi:hypothetical protein
MNTSTRICCYLKFGHNLGMMTESFTKNELFMTNPGSGTHQRPNNLHTNFVIIQYLQEARGGAVVEALRYKPEGCRINSQWCHWNFSLT